MMQLPQEAIEELKQIYKSEFHKEMSDDEAMSEARRILLFFYEFFKWESDERAKADDLKVRNDSMNLPITQSQNTAMEKALVGQLRLFE